MNEDIIIEGLRKARIFIRSVEAWREEANPIATLDEVLEEWAKGGEVEAIDEALRELGYIV